MADELERQKSIFETTVENMKSLGIYKPEYDGTIQIYAQLCEQYIIITERFEKSRYQLQTKSAQGGMKKSPIVATLENLRKDILSYSDRLCLNPKAFDSLGKEVQPEKSKLEAVMEKLGAQDG